MELAQKYTIDKKSTIFIQSLWNLVKIRYSWVAYLNIVLQWLGKNCGFFNKSIFLAQSGFSVACLYDFHHITCLINIINSTSEFISKNVFYVIWHENLGKKLLSLVCIKLFFLQGNPEESVFKWSRQFSNSIQTWFFSQYFSTYK